MTTETGTMSTTIDQTTGGNADASGAVAPDTAAVQPSPKTEARPATARTSSGKAARAPSPPRKMTGVITMAAAAKKRSRQGSLRNRHRRVERCDQGRL